MQRPDLFEVIHVEQWAAAERLRERNRSLLRTKRTAPRLYCLVGLLKRGACGAKMVGKSAGPSRATNYYQCGGRKYRRPRYGFNTPLAPCAEALEG